MKVSHEQTSRHFSNTALNENDGWATFFVVLQQKFIAQRGTKYTLALSRQKIDLYPVKIFFNQEEIARCLPTYLDDYPKVCSKGLLPDIVHIYQPLRSGRIWHMVNF